MTQKRLYVWIEAALAAVVSLLVSFIPIELGPSFGVNLGVIGIFIIAFRRDYKAGILAGFLWGILKLLTGTADVLTPFQGFLEYMFAFGFGGLAGFWANQVKTAIKANQSAQLLLYTGEGTFIAMLCQYFIHFIAGVFFWNQFAPEGMSAVYYSFVMNSLSGIATWIFGWLITFLLIKVAPQLITSRRA